MQIKATELFLFSFFEIKELIHYSKPIPLLCIPICLSSKTRRVCLCECNSQCQWLKFLRFFYSRSCPILQWRIQDFFKEANHQKFLFHSISNHNFLVRQLVNHIGGPALYIFFNREKGENKAFFMGLGAGAIAAASIGYNNFSITPGTM